MKQLNVETSIIETLIKRASVEVEGFSDEVADEIRNGSLFIFDNDGSIVIEGAIESGTEASRSMSGAKPHMIALAIAARESVAVGETWSVVIPDSFWDASKAGKRGDSRRAWFFYVEGELTSAWKALSSITSEENDTFKFDAVDWKEDHKKVFEGGKLTLKSWITFTGKRAS